MKKAFHTAIADRIGGSSGPRSPRPCVLDADLVARRGVGTPTDEKIVHSQQALPIVQRCLGQGHIPDRAFARVEFRHDPRQLSGGKGHKHAVPAPGIWIDLD